MINVRRRKGKFDHPAEELHPVPVPNRSWKQIGIDLIGPLPTTTNGNKYVISVTDHFSKWPEARASPTKEAINVTEFLNDLILRHGCPDVAISDQGTEFCNQVCPHVHYQTNVTLQCSETYGVVVILTWWDGEGCLVAWVRGIAWDEGSWGVGGGGLSGCMGQRD